MGEFIGALEDALGEGCVRGFFAVGNEVASDSVILDVTLLRFCDAPIVFVNGHSIVPHMGAASRNSPQLESRASKSSDHASKFRHCRTLILLYLIHETNVPDQYRCSFSYSPPSERLARHGNREAGSWRRSRVVNYGETC